MTERVTTRATAMLAALLLVMGMAIVAMSTTGEGGFAYVHAAEQAKASPSGTGNACPPASPQGEDADPSCGKEGKGPQGDKDKGDKDKGDKGKGDKGKGDKDKGETGAACPPSSPNTGGQPPCGPGDGDTGAACPPSSPNAGGQPPCGPGDGDNGDPPECEEGETFNPETGECEEDGNGGTPECEEGETFNPETGECEEDEVETQRCDTPDGLELLDDGTIAKFLHDNDPTGLSSNPVADGPLSGAVYEGGEDTPLEPLTDEAGCLVSLTGAL